MERIAALETYVEDLRGAVHALTHIVYLGAGLFSQTCDVCGRGMADEPGPILISVQVEGT